MTDMSSTEKAPPTVSRKTLPLAIIQRIFTSFNTPCHRHPHDKCKRLSCRSSSPLLLGKVCKEWRDVAWNLPTIWTWLSIPVSPEISDVQLQLVEEWLHRAADQPLSIIIRPAPSRSMRVYGNLSPQTPEIFKLIVNYSMQWKALEIESTAPCTEFLTPAYGRTPILETVFIHSAETQFKNPSPLKFLGNAPNLHNLHCVGIGKIGGITHPWTNLISFKSTSVNLTTFPFLLNYAPNIQHLNLELPPISGTSQDAPNDEILTLPLHLTSLIIKGWHTTPYIKRMKAPPTLERLTILHNGKEVLTQYSFTPVIDFIDRAKCNLRAFGIFTEVLPVDVESLRELFSKLHFVTCLYVNSKVTASYKAMMNQIPRMLDPTPDPTLRMSASMDMDRVLLPHLQVLYYCAVDTGLKSQRLIDMIKHRCKGKDDFNDTDATFGEFAKLKVVRFSKTNPKILVEALQEEIAQGLEVTYDLPYEGEPFE